MTEYECHDCSHVWEREGVAEKFVDCPGCEAQNASILAASRATDVTRSVSITDESGATGPDAQQSFAGTVPTNGRLGPDDFEDREYGLPIKDASETIGTGKDDLEIESCSPPESPNTDDPREGGMGDVECGLDGCRKQAVVEILDADDALGEDPNRCVDCVGYYLRQHRDRWD